MTVSLNPGTDIQTAGVASHVIFAKSVGGGGGNAKASGVVKNGIFAIKSIPFALTIGGSGSASGNGGQVTVDIKDGAIRMTGPDAIAIVAQSIGGGGGGLAHLTTMDALLTPSANPAEVRTPPIQEFFPSIKFGGKGGKAGDGGAVAITIEGNPAQITTAVSTTGQNAHGLVAQSLGGSGGAAMGARG
ncbi:hypothetical protein [Roseovarius sp. M141]|uniref:hypothetical protein n=1 Tax=Roseovarius sp. M141 TaxID=2583806 RepID=UPI0020CB83B5|nr:hypothetical protein [Roseovarius sp. M141]